MVNIRRPGREGPQNLGDSGTSSIRGKLADLISRMEYIHSWLMKDTKLLEQLQTVVPRLGIELKEVDGDFTGGLCCVKGRKVLLINSSLTTRKMIEIMCRELASQDLSNIFILPAVRRKIEACNTLRQSLQS